MVLPSNKLHITKKRDCFSSLGYFACVLPIRWCLFKDAMMETAIGGRQGIEYERATCLMTSSFDVVPKYNVCVLNIWLFGWMCFPADSVVKMGDRCHMTNVGKLLDIHNHIIRRNNEKLRHFVYHYALKNTQPELNIFFLQRK